MELLLQFPIHMKLLNVCGMNGIKYMIHSASFSPMKIFFGAPSCVPATTMETAGSNIGDKEIEELFYKDYCSHLSEVMNYPGVIYNDPLVIKKLNIAKRYKKCD